MSVRGGDSMLHIGYGNFVCKDKILAITIANTAPLIRKRQNAEDRDLVIDCTKGASTNSLLHLKDGYIVLSTIGSDALNSRMER